MAYTRFASLKTTGYSEFHPGRNGKRPNGLMCFGMNGRDVAQGLVIDLLPLGPQLANDLSDLNHIPGNHGVVQNR